MTGEHLLLLVAISAAISAITAARRGARSWIVVNVMFFVASAIGYFVAPVRAGLWLVGPYVLFAVVPLVATMQIYRSLLARRFRTATVLAHVAAVLHPSKSFRRLVQTVEVHELSARGDVDKALAILRELGLDSELQVEMLRLQNRWDEVVEHVEASAGDPIDRLGGLYIRALGETGRIDKMLGVYRTLNERWASRDDMTEELATVRMFVAAFLGQHEIVAEVVAGPLAHHSPSIKMYWLATAEQIGGDRAWAAEAWGELAQYGEARMRSAAEHRAHHPLSPAELTDDRKVIVAELAEDIRRSATYAGKSADAPLPVLSYAFVAALAVVQVIVWLQQQRGSYELLELGVFWSPAVLDGDWWRIVTAVFLHAGWLHLGFNVFGLLWFGPFVERFVGRRSFALLFLAGGVGGFALLATLDVLDVRGATAALGASGAVMALLGAGAGIFLRGRTRSPIAAARLRDMLVFVGVQVIFDLLAPQVSMTGHLTGLVIGFGLGLLAKPK